MDNNTIGRHRGHYLAHLIDYFESQPGVRALHVTAICALPDNPDAPLLFDAPVDKINPDSGAFTANVVHSAVGYRNFTDKGLACAMRINGRETQMVIPYGAIVQFAAFDQGMSLIAGELFTFIPPISETRADTPSESAPASASTASANVVSLADRKR